MGSVLRSLRLHGGLPVGTALDLEGAVQELRNVKMDDNADVGGGGTTGPVGFQVTDFAGDDLAEKVILELGVYDEASGDATKPGAAAAAATLNTATSGLILDGAGSAAIVVETDATGRFDCTLTDAVDETVILACRSARGSSVLDCRELDSVTFSA